MPFEDITIKCTDCEEEFVFSAGEQEFYKEKNLESQPKRCQKCRRSKKKQRYLKKGKREYRSVAFENSSPIHQRVRYKGGHYKNQRQNRDYRSPSFRGKEIDASKEYRSPAFAQSMKIRPDQEYRAPGFKEYEKINVEEEYRNPGFQEIKDKYKDEKPMFSITCEKCNEEAMVPYLPEEKEVRLCQECHKKELQKLRKEKIALEQEKPDTEKAKTNNT